MLNSHGVRHKIAFGIHFITIIMRTLAILWTILTIAESTPTEFVDPNCPDYDLSLTCSSKCDDAYLECVTTCSSSDCLMECNRAAVTCGDACPCHTDCIDGCKGCDNPICFCNDDSNEDNLDACLSKTSKTLGQCILDCDNDSSCETACVSAFKDEHSKCPCQEKCPIGCPCDDYDCDLPEKKAILTLYSRSSSTPPVLIQPNGGVTENFEFKINDDTQVYRSCSATLNGEVFVFGGDSSSNNRRKQVSKIVGCELKRVGDLNYEFYFGACGTYNFPDQRILLCFSNEKNTGCESYDGYIFHNQADAKKGHYKTSLGNIDEAPLAVGGDNSYTNKAEILDIASNTWTEIAEYPYHDYIYGYATVTTSQGALIIGGYSAGFVATVACYNNAGWSRLDDLQSTRYWHRAIVNGDKVYVIGGYGNEYTEIWGDDEGSKNIKLADPKLDGYYHYPEVVLVDVNYCVKP